MPLRIAHVTNEPFGLQTANGVQHAVYSLAQAQAQVGESVAIVQADVSNIAQGLTRATALGSEGLRQMGMRARNVAAAYPRWDSIATKMVTEIRNVLVIPH